ncbi:MFS transporter [Paracoccus aminophilus]|uniref:Major facilitator superfamily protein n=1 Tax=Paracoccus aminophilus JCM 7686 TaxID=1367847 RepID=S5YAE9_PARAH|nr:MFS transporter [Paracoccus aminophilus]AGT08403.1 major facilitator superfamily protein [Paracoccus aminophilus JCM 7686]
MQADISRDGRAPWGALLGVNAAIGAFGFSQGLSYPLFTLLMQQQGMSPAAIGASAAMMPLGLILSASLVPSLVRLFGMRQLAVGCALAAALCFFLIGVFQSWVGWFVLRFLLGIIINPLYVLGEVWALSLAPPARRGRMMGVFNTVMSAAYASGPLALAMIGVEGWTPFLVGVGGFCLASVGLALVSRRLPVLSFDQDESGTNKGVFAFWTVAPALLTAVCVSAASLQANVALLPVFGAGYGLSELTLPRLVTALSVGNIFIQLPLGIAAERIGPRFMIIFCASMTVVAAVLLPSFILTPAVWPLLMLLGGMSYGVYTMALIELGNRFHGQMLVAGNAAFAMMWGMGGMLGAPGAGVLMQAIGPVGLPVVITVLMSVLITLAILRKIQRELR